MEPEDIGKLVFDRRIEIGMSQEKLADSTDTGQSTIDRIEKGKFKRMPSVLPKVFKVLGLDLDTIENPSVDPVMLRTGILPATLIQGQHRDFPIYACAEGGPGEVIRSLDVIDYVPRPAPVAHVRDAYGMLVSGESMVPEYRPGDIAIVNPRLPIIGGEVFVFYRELHGEARATIKHLRRALPDTWHLTQWNPPQGMKADFTLPRKEWAIPHRVIGKHTRQ